MTWLSCKFEPTMEVLKEAFTEEPRNQVPFMRMREMQQLQDGDTVIGRVPISLLFKLDKYLTIITYELRDVPDKKTMSPEEIRRHIKFFEFNYTPHPDKSLVLVGEVQVKSEAKED